MLSYAYFVFPSIPQFIFPYIGFITVALGLLMAFAGREMWEILTAIIGIILGAIIGMAFGASIDGLIGSILLGIIGAVIGGLLFYYIAEIGISIFIAYFALVGTLILFGARGGVLSNIAHGATIALAVALVVAIVVFILCIIYFEELIVVFTAIAGGLLVDYGLTLFGFGVVAVIAAIAVVVIGIIFQLTLLERFRGPVEPDTKNVTYTHTETTSSSSTDTPVTHRDN
ncbi:MAG: hypothetical protein KIS30_03220 [Thermoplasmata archaeon]|nr:hypothetical protein [Candidatus Sysuiplasma acidicola]MBX8638514.1 hypothetical protein [Candidatus Sysuiplasma acidicola]MBX8645755.1 hypothetical protein [Candidatus Sysuiplasma acidicola]